MGLNSAFCGRVGSGQEHDAHLFSLCAVHRDPITKLPNYQITQFFKAAG